MPFVNIVEKREYQRQWISNRRAEYFQNKQCAKCGSIKNLELDHIDPSEKVSHRIWSWSAERRNEELAKCQVLCAECHLEKSLAERPQPQHGRAGMYKRGCRCEQCNEWNRIRVRAYRERQKAIRVSAHSPSKP